MSDFRAKMLEIRFQLRPKPCCESLSTPPDLLAELRQLLLRWQGSDCGEEDREERRGKERRGSILLLLLVWQAPLGVPSAKRRHQSPEWTIISHSYRLIQ